MKLADDHTPSVLFIGAAPMFMRRCGMDPYVSKVAQANIQPILPTFIVNTITQARPNAALPGGNEL
jgi:hypothetical protein